ncbi:MAG: ABC transporter substrate-binding protein [Balneolia bacterium]|nr:ABC transporter substrate-binding protein [Balneolia bacterium]
MRVLFLSALLVSIALVFSTAVYAVSQDVEDEVRAMLIERDQEIKDLLGPEGAEHTDEQRQELMDIINEVIDYRAMAQHALQDTWEELSPEQRDEFVDVFARVVRDQSLNSLDIYRADVTYESFDVRDGGNRVTARTIATLQNVRTPVIYELENRDGEWIVIDMSIDSVSTADSYRRSFQRIINRRGYDALLANLKNRAGIS